MLDEPINVLHVFGHFDRGGAESMVMNLFRFIDHSKVKFGFVVHGEKVGAFEKEVMSMGAEVFRVPNYKGTNHFEYKKAWNNILKNNPKYSIIHGHVRSTANVYLKMAKKKGLKTISHSHSTSSGKGISAKIKNLFQYGIRYHADEFLACSVEAGKWLFGEKICSKETFHVLNNAIDTSMYSFNKDIRERKRKELGLENHFTVGHVGRFHEAKNHDTILEVFYEIQKINTNAILLLVGEGQLIEQTKRKAEKLSIDDKVVFLGARSDVNELLQAMDVFLFPSLFEGLPVTLVETQAAGLPAVVSENITSEIKITDLIDFVSLEESYQKWASIVLEKINQTQRKNTKKQIISAQYDIAVTSKWYTKFIIELEKRK